jgi:hypothetical protein
MTSSRSTPEPRRARRTAVALSVASVVVLALTTAAGAATTPQPAPGLAVGAASVSGSAPSQVHLFYQRPDRGLTLKTGAGNQDLGGILTSGVVALAPTEFTDEAVFARGTNGAVFSRSFSDDLDEWFPWGSVGGQAHGAPGVTCTGNGADPLIYVRGLDSALWRWTLAGWATRGGSLLSDPAGLAPVAGVCPAAEEVFAIGGDGAVWRWSSAGWAKVGGRSTLAPSATLVPGGGADLVARGPDNAAWIAHRSSGGTFGAFGRIGGVFTSPVTVVVDTTAPARRLVFGLGTDGNLWQASDVIGGADTWSLSQVP